MSSETTSGACTPVRGLLPLTSDAKSQACMPVHGLLLLSGYFIPMRQYVITSLASCRLGEHNFAQLQPAVQKSSSATAATDGTACLNL